MNKEATPQIEVDATFAAIIEREYETANTSEALGKAAVSQIEPFGRQFMDDIVETIGNPKATTPSGQTVTTDKGAASLDDSSSNDVA